MKKVLLLSAVLISVVLLAAGLTGCGGSGSGILPTPIPAPTPNPTPTPGPATSSLGFAFLRNDGTTSGAATMTAQQRQAARRAAKIAHAASRQAAITVDSGLVNIYVWPFTEGSAGWWFASERKITASAAGYTSVHLSLNRTSIVFSATVNGYNQIFTSTVPAEGQTLGEPIQLTTDMENHWVPHIAADGSKVAFTKSDPNSNGDVVCIINNAAGATETCLDFSSTTPVLKGADMWHASWTPDGKIVFEAFQDVGATLDEIFMVNADGSGLTQITKNAGTKNYDECPSVSSDGNYMAVDTWNDTTQYYEITVIDLKTKQRSTYTSGTYTHADAWDPLLTPYSVVWVSQLPTDQSLELYILTYDDTRMTNNTYADYFESSPR